MTSPSGHKEQAERKEVLENDRKVREQATTMHQFAISEASEPRGRFSATNKETVVGSMPVVNYPAAPNWSPDPVPPEPALGFEIDTVEVVGTPQEIEASIAALKSDEKDQ
jgi:hypothetical protein